MSRHHGSDAATVRVPTLGRAWTDAVHVCALRCDGCGEILCVGPRNTAEHAERVTLNRAFQTGWHLSEVSKRDLCKRCVTKEIGGA